MPAAKSMAGVDMRLEPGGYRELHWHIAAEWALVLNGSCRIQVGFFHPELQEINAAGPDANCHSTSLKAINENGESFVDDVGKGDVWFFPP
jgi:oxalate decarboxylase/phosphoglucose isomerase-like protein (cupin superfamily)